MERFHNRQIKVIPDVLCINRLTEVEAFNLSNLLCFQVQSWPNLLQPLNSSQTHSKTTSSPPASQPRSSRKRRVAPTERSDKRHSVNTTSVEKFYDTTKEQHKPPWIPNIASSNRNSFAAKSCVDLVSPWSGANNGGGPASPTSYRHSVGIHENHLKDPSSGRSELNVSSSRGFINNSSNRISGSISEPYLNMDKSILKV